MNRFADGYPTPVGVASGVVVDCSVAVIVSLAVGVAAPSTPPLGLALGASAPAGADDVGDGTVVAAEVGVGDGVVGLAECDALAEGVASSRRGTGRGRGPAGPIGMTV
jgi:hypothetical protein